MRLVVHAGTHKTATTAFQEICHHNRAALMAAGICYPEWEKRKNHGFLALSLRQGDTAHVGKLLSRAVRRCAPGDTILISGEGLERCFVDVKMAFDLEDIAHRCGIDTVEWVVVERQPFDYFQSLYGELCKQYLAMNYVEMAETILKHGFLSAACKYYDYMFVFDGRKFFTEFPAYRGATLHVLPFQTFTRPYPGHAIIADILARAAVADALALPDTDPSNERFSPAEIERRYACNFLGLRPDAPLDDASRALVESLISRRLAQIADVQDDLARRFDKRFGTSKWKSLWPRGRGGR